MDTTNPADRQPKGDHNRRMALGLSREEFAAEAGISEEALRVYETTGPDDDYDPAIAQQIGAALDRVEAAATAQDGISR